MTLGNSDLVDPGDFCRFCLGRGVEREAVEGSYVVGDCQFCRGTGHRTITVNPAPAAQLGAR